ncbi:MAG: hypothetical protein NVS2B3_17750 [Vulcanimicrobiaceae bacterium]
MAQHDYAETNVYTTAKRFDLRFGYLAQTATIFALVGAVLWTVLLSGFLPAHDATHWLRHLLGVIPCH